MGLRPGRHRGRREGVAMIAALTIAVVLLSVTLLAMWVINHCLQTDPDADPLEAAPAPVLPREAVEEADAMAAYAEANNPAPLLALRTHRVLMPQCQLTDSQIKRRVTVGVGFVLAMICLSAWMGAR